MDRKTIEAVNDHQIRAQLWVANNFLGVAYDQELTRDAQLQLNPKSLEDLRPKESDFIFARFRALSKAYLPSHYIDFSKGDVLKESVPLLKGQTVYPDHVHRVEGWLGVVTESEWDETLRPNAPGVNTVWKIDALANPKIARGLMMKPPALHSSSVYVIFEWEKSHPELNGYKFWDFLGEEFEGHIVCIVATKIHAYWEHSLVWQGADQAAKNLGDAENEIQQFRKQMLSQHKPAQASVPDLPGTPLLKNPPTKQQLQKLRSTFQHLQSSNPTEELMEEKELELQVGSIQPFRKETLAMLGIKEAEPSMERIESAVLSLTEKNAALAKEVEQLKPEAENGRAYLADMRAEALRLASIVETPGGKIKDSVAKLIAGASLEAAKDLVSMYQVKADQLFPEKCQACGSTDVVRRSSIEQQTGSDAQVTIPRPEQFQLRRK